MNQLDRLTEKIEKQDVKTKGALELYRPDELVEDYIKSIVRAKNHPLSFGLPSIDEELRGDIRGKISAIIGYGGTRKSLLCLNMVNFNAHNHRSNAIYSTMEMSYNAMLSRLLDYSIASEDNNTSVNVWDQVEEENQNKMIEFLKESFVNYYADSILLNQKNGMTYKEYKQLLKKAKDLGKTVDILAVDGLSMMGGQGSEREKVDDNTMMLKELAKEEDIFIPLIVHASRGESKHCRDLFNKCRGSEKIIDNVDFAFTCSLVQRFENPNEYEKESGYIRLWNKRDTGNVVNTVYDFYPNRLMIEESVRKPEDVEIESQKGLF